MIEIYEGEQEKMFNEYLEKTEYVDYNDGNVKNLAEKIKSESMDELSPG